MNRSLFSIYLFLAITFLPIRAMGGDFYQGMWRAELDLGKEVLPFNLEIYGGLNSMRALQMTIINGDEFIKVDEIAVRDDGFIEARLPVFNSSLVFKQKEDRLEGHWINYAKSADYKLPFTAQAGLKERFIVESLPPAADLSGRWEVTFSPDTDDSYPAVGEFKQIGNHVSATFITETGDYRYLEGILNGNKLKLSTFDGAHAFLFIADLSALESEKEVKTLKGIFYSGSHWEEPWIAHENAKATLKDPNELTFLKDGFANIEFSFPDEQDKMISFSDKKFRGKVVIVQVLGTWCPNCMDETRLYTQLYNRYCDEGLEIVGLAFEATEDKAEAWTRLSRYKEQLGIEYDLLYSGKASKGVASEALPMLNRIISFPTSIILDRDGIVRKIHTGFYGPATSEYATYTKDFEKYLVGLLSQ